MSKRLYSIIYVSGDISCCTATPEVLTRDGITTADNLKAKYGVAVAAYVDLGPHKQEDKSDDNAAH